MNSLVLAFVFCAGSSPGDWSPPIRVMSFNIRYGTAADGENHWNKRREFLVDTIRSFDPDLLGTQETLAFQRDYLQKELAGYEVVSAGRDDGKERGEMAALYYRSSRFEKLASGHFWLSESPDRVGSVGWDAALTRIASWVKLKDRRSPDSQPIFYINVHFDHRGKQARLESAKLMRSKIGELGKDCRVVVTGDFNAGEKSAPYEALFSKLDGNESPLIDVYRSVHPDRAKNEGTYTGFKAGNDSGARIDWIACSRDLEVRLAAIDRTSKDGRTPSDHLPVTAVLRAKPKEQTLRVLCYNIHHGRGTDNKVDLPRIAKVIRAADPDLVALQEVDDRTRRTGGVDQTTELGRLTGLHAQFGRQIDFEGGRYGQAILSRFPITRTAVHMLPGEPPREQRLAFEAHVVVEGKPLCFVTAHLHHIKEEFRTRQVAKLNELFGSHEHAVILAGDLNAGPGSKPISMLGPIWTIANSDPKLLTFPSHKPTIQIDFILFRAKDPFQAVESKVIDEPVASDHRPVLSVLKFTK